MASITDTAAMPAVQKERHAIAAGQSAQARRRRSGPTSPPTSWPVLSQPSAIAEPLFRHLARNQRDRRARRSPANAPISARNAKNCQTFVDMPISAVNTPMAMLGAHQHELAAAPVGQPAPERRDEGRDKRGRAVQDAGPEIDRRAALARRAPAGTAA